MKPPRVLLLILGGFVFEGTIRLSQGVFVFKLPVQTLTREPD
jgi:hypothetical protein